MLVPACLYKRQKYNFKKIICVVMNDQYTMLIFYRSAKQKRNESISPVSFFNFQHIKIGPSKHPDKHQLSLLKIKHKKTV